MASGGAKRGQAAAPPPSSVMKSRAACRSLASSRRGGAAGITSSRRWAVGCSTLNLPQEGQQVLGVVLRADEGPSRAEGDRRSRRWLQVAPGSAFGRHRAGRHDSTTAAEDRALRARHTARPNIDGRGLRADRRHGRARGPLNRRSDRAKAARLHGVSEERVRAALLTLVDPITGQKTREMRRKKNFCVIERNGSATPASCLRGRGSMAGLCTPLSTLRDALAGNCVMGGSMRSATPPS